jgi:GNAT superfamily N-acetyltransferase
MFFVEGVDALYAEHQAQGAEIITRLQNEPWGVREYTLCDLNGYHLRFGQFAHETPAPAAPVEGLVLVNRRPTQDEYRDLLTSVGWDQFITDERVVNSPASAWRSVVAEVGGRAIGAGLVVGDGATIYYLKDVMVRPEYQGRGVGTAIVADLLEAIRRHGPSRALVGLYTGRGLSSFYERFGFVGPEDGLYGMTMRI